MRCKTCSHPDHQQIDEQLVAGVSPLTLAKKYGLHFMTVYRHKEKHLPLQMVKARQLQEVDTADNLMNRVEDLYNKARGIIDKAEAEKNYTATVQAIRETRSTLELIGRLLGELKSGNTINLVYNPQWIELRGTIYQALEDYPEARLKLAEALSQVEEVEVIEGDCTEHSPAP